MTLDEQTLIHDLAKLLFRVSHEEPWEQGMDEAKAIYLEESAAAVKAGWRPVPINP